MLNFVLKYYNKNLKIFCNAIKLYKLKSIKKNMSRL